MGTTLSDSLSQILDGVFFGFGVLAIYLGAVFTGVLIRSLGGAGSAGVTLAGRYVQGWFFTLRGDDRDIVNVTLNMIVNGELKFDTLVADRPAFSVWRNAYRVLLIRRAAKRTTEENPLILFPPRTTPPPRTWSSRWRRRTAERIEGILASETIVENGRKERVHLMREDDYRATYRPLINLVSEKCTNDGAIDFAVGRPMDEFRFVIALTFEKLEDRRARHLRAMVILEDTLLQLPEECPRVEIPEHQRRFKTLQAVAAHYRVRPEHFGTVNLWRPKSNAK